jgi:hypothetical protein
MSDPIQALVLQARPNKLASRLWLLLTLLVFLALVGVFGWAMAERGAQIAMRQGLAGDIDDLYAFAFTYVLLFVLLSTMPLLMVIGYHGLQGEILSAQLQEHLAMAGLRDSQLRARMLEYQQRNSFSAFFLPMLVNTLLLLVLWATTLLPHGIAGMLDYLSSGGTLKVGVAFMFPRIAADAALVNWALLGAYFYGLLLLIRRWMQSDLTTGVIWKLNVRFVIAFLLGLLLTRIVSEGGTVSAELGPWTMLLAFSIGIVPDVFLRWASRQLKRIGRVDAEEMARLFTPSDLQRRIPGMSFWQLDRLAEEDIESVQDLAMRAIPTLLIHTRFDTALMMSWVDRALLADQAGEQLPLFQRAHVHSATALIARVQTETGRAALLRSMDKAAEWECARSDTEAPGSLAEPPRRTVERVTEEQLGNIVSGLQNGPNLRELTCYWAAVGAPHRGPAGLNAAAAGESDDRRPAAGAAPAAASSARPVAGSAN